MSRKTTWKSTYVRSNFDLRQLQGASHGAPEVKRYTTVAGVNGIETNMPWWMLRLWFSSAGVPLPPVSTGDAPSWIAYAEPGEEPDVPPLGFTFGGW